MSEARAGAMDWNRSPGSWSRRARSEARLARSLRSAAFTLIELILVMATLAAVLAVGAPSLARFFRGRTLELEGRRFLALTRYAQSRAVSEGVPMVLWIDLRDGSYGLRQAAGFAQGTPQSVAAYSGTSLAGDLKTYQLGDDLRFELAPSELARSRTPRIQFAPDGSIDESSVRSLVIRQDQRQWVTVMQSENRLMYELRQNQSAPPELYR